MSEKKSTRRGFENTVEGLLSLACYISLPLILLFALTMGMSLLVTGGISTDVNNESDLLTVLLSFSLPMVAALGAVPLLFKRLLQKRPLIDLGLGFRKRPLDIGACAAMAIGTVLLAFKLSGAEGLEMSPFTVWLHFFFVALAEEIMLRCVVMDELRGFTNNRWLLCLLNGVIFAFVYHSNDGFLPNLLVRVPLGFVLSYVREKSGSVYPAVMLHWLYNMLVTTI